MSAEPWDGALELQISITNLPPREYIKVLLARVCFVFGKHKKGICYN